LKKFSKNIFYVSIVIITALLNSCSDNNVAPVKDAGTVIFSRTGLVDSAVVNGCYPDLRRFFVDTLDIKGYSNLRVEFDGFTNSDGSYIKIFCNTESSSNIEKYSVEDAVNINNHHVFKFSKPAEKVWMEVRIYINPPVCGQGEFKYTRVRDLTIYAIR
jgi:hypothetical protein